MLLVVCQLFFLFFLLLLLPDDWMTMQSETENIKIGNSNCLVVIMKHRTMVHLDGSANEKRDFIFALFLFRIFIRAFQRRTLIGFWFDFCNSIAYLANSLQHNWSLKTKTKYISCKIDNKKGKKIELKIKRRLKCIHFGIDQKR